MARIRRNSEQTLEFKIEQAEAKVARTREAHEKAVDELKKLYDIRKAYQRDELLKALESSHRSYDEILAFIEGRDDDIDRNTPGKNKNPRSIFTCFYLKAPSKIISANLTFRSLTAPDNSNIPLVLSVTIKVKVFS